MSACKYCGDLIGWKNEGGNWRPMNADGLPHTCIPRRQPQVIPGKHVVGARYQPTCGQCATPPWEVCSCSDGARA